MNKGNVVYISGGILCSHNKNKNYAICKKRDGSGDDHAEGKSKT
jgi:hypothetical protein